MPFLKFLILEEELIGLEIEHIVDNKINKIDDISSNIKKKHKEIKTDDNIKQLELDKTIKIEEEKTKQLELEHKTLQLKLELLKFSKNNFLEKI